MKQETHKSGKLRMIAAVSAVVIVSGSIAGALALRPHTDAQATENAAEAAASRSSQEDLISAGGTITSAQLTDTLGLESTAAQLTVERVLVESGDDVTAGTALYQITEDSLAKAEKTLRSELQSAESALLQEQVSAQVEKSQAYALYQSELLTGDTAQEDYSSALSDLDTALQDAYAAYQEAQSTVDNAPTEISQKQAELESRQSEEAQLSQEMTAVQEQVNAAKSAYSASVENYNSAAAEYNAAAGAVRYLGNYLGIDTAGITLAQTVSAASDTQSTPSGDAGTQMPAQSEGAPTEFGTDFSGSIPHGSNGSLTASAQSTPVSQAADASDETQAQQDAVSGELTALYDSAYATYQAQKQELAQAEEAMQAAEADYNTCSAALTECTAALKDVQSTETSLSKEISSLNSALSKAKSNLSGLREEYNSLKASYETDRLSLGLTYDTDTNAGENAEYHYQLTLSTIEETLADAQDARDTAEENLRIFEEELAEGCIRAKQDGVIASLGCQENRSVNLGSPYVYYVDDTTFGTTVELSQNDVTQISIGDSVMIYSSESGIVNGKVTAIAAGTSNSLADVRFNVSITADENANLYSGQSVNVYFNSGSSDMSSFSDYKGDAEGSADGGRPDFGGGMPEGFDPSNLPEFNGRKDD